MHIPMLRGRDRLRETVADLLVRAEAGAGGALLLHGDPGSGRTALLRHTAARAPGWTVLGVGGLHDEADLPYAALHGLLQPVGDRPGLLPPHQAKVLHGVLTAGGCAGPDRLALSMAVLTLLGALGRERPVLCCVDDADAVDRPSMAVLGFAARRLRGQRVAMLLTAGPGTTLAGVPYHALEPLAPDAARQLLADLLADGDAPLDDDAAAALAAVAAGNPQALTELARCLTPAQREGDAPLPTRLPEGSVLRLAYRERLDRLPADTRWLLLLAAADDEMDAAGLLRAARADGVDIGALAPAERQGLVRVDRGAVVFAQPMVRALAYEEAPLARRRAAHLHLADVLDPDRDRLRRAVHLAAAAHGPDPALAEELEHAAAAGGSACGGYSRAATALEHAAQLSDEPVGAAIRLVTAARYAWQSGSPQRARRLLRQARPATRDQAVVGESEVLAGEIELRAGATATAADTLLATAARLAATDRELAVHALLRVGEALCFSGDYPRFGEVALRAARLRRADDPPYLNVIFEHFAGFAATFLGRHDRAVAPLRRVIELAGEVDRATTLTCAAASALLLADDIGAHRLAARAVEVVRETGEVCELPLALEMTAYAEYWLGRHEAATATSLHGLRAARAGGQDNYAADHLGMLAVLAAVRGDRDACLRRVREIELAPGAGRANRPKALTQWAQAVLDLLGGRPADAVTRIAAIADPVTGRGHVVVQALATPWLVEAAVRADERERALPALNSFSSWADATGDPARRALAARCRALLAPRASAEADEWFQRALLLHRAAESDYERARTELLYGQELRRSRRPRDAREHLHRCLETFTRLDMPTWIEQARAELRAAGEAVQAPEVTAVEVLTAQQLQIARLVVDGATNREVAAQLFLSTRTVDHHMRNIFSRLGIRSRIELHKALT
ncbi:LuxR C-terminal-related transcriptional regulator [Catellatospora sp. KI3]|uniref:helix-turn-helix transcriptional regulator n=1 Tax=Catellatospora sp. KI3 TaxID=3041620 RepID=UPI00248274B3|nr:LuxR family transcriptional regulator [Catellatospora sp. KI3]MDI1463825.1 LuxR C-terminal-related transcriptional regulator [Catellatospora sp. KI3]